MHPAALYHSVSQSAVMTHCSPVSYWQKPVEPPPVRSPPRSVSGRRAAGLIEQIWMTAPSGWPVAHWTSMPVASMVVALQFQRRFYVAWQLSMVFLTVRRR